MLSPKDKRILAELQNDFPLVPDPFAVVARRLKMEAGQFLVAVRALERRKLIRYIGATFDVRKAGCVSTLAALEVPRERIAATAAYIAGQPRITHNYLRPGRMNMWFTVSGFSAGDNGRLIEGIRKRCGLTAALDLSTEKVYKIDARFELRTSAPLRRELGTAAAAIGRGAACRCTVAVRRRVVVPARLLAPLSASLAVVPRPFAGIGRRYGLSEKQVIAAFKKYLDSGFIRRCGAVLEHRRVGLRANVMVAWEVAAKNIDAAGASMAGIAQVSHCYCRKSYPQWPFNLYTMVHARTPGECRRIIALILRRNKHTIKQYRQLRTLRELKKTRMDLRWMKKAA